MQDLVPGIALDSQGSGAERLGRPRTDPLPRQHVAGVVAEADRLDGA